ncbi:hypothetical protein QTP70_007883 [Hemibagrus guttatus]|uniref:WD repeat-containing protein 81 n=1 Tax=Hemibagrus guttatus TaxID=175788 RepID=A0AAE0QSA6_9TELE|nr:hypothetical protein QTP70_007883 [Hemibagrus guttatus]
MGIACFLLGRSLISDTTASAQISASLADILSWMLAYQLNFNPSKTELLVILESEKMPEEWRRSVLVPIFKNKGDVQSCSNYRGIKLMSHTMKLWERVVEAGFKRKVVEICEQQYCFMPRKSTTDAIFALRILMEKYRDGQRELHCVFVDLEKAYDRVPREELWYCMRKSGVAEKYVRVVQDMYERSRTVVRCAVGQTEEFKVEVGLHQGSALSPFLFAIVMDQLSEEVRQESPWTMMFADDIVICSESREQVEENLERWRFALEIRGMKVSRSKTEYMCVNEREGSGTVRLQGEDVKKVQEFKYLRSTVQSNGECGKEVKNDGDIRTLLQRSQVKLPPGWTRVCIQGLRKSKLGYRIAQEPGWHGEAFSQESFMRQMQEVSECNISLLPHVLQVITGFESCRTGAGSVWDGLKALRGGMGGLGEEEEDYECVNGRPSSAASAGKVGGGSSGGSGGVGAGDPEPVDYSSGISLNDQVFIADGEDFQNGFYVNNGSSVPTAGVSAKLQGKNSANKDQDQESLSVGKLSDKSSASEVSIGDGDSTKDRASLKSADSSQDLKQTSDGEDGGDLEDEDATVEEKESTVQKVPSLELTLSGCTEESEATVATLEGDFMNGMVQGESDKNIGEEDDEHDPSENSEEKEHKILLDTVCKTVRWLSAKLGPTVTSRYVAKNLLRLLTTCYIGLEKHQFLLPANEENSLDSSGSVYEKKPIVGDQTAKPVLDCLIYIAHLYGEPVLTYQYLPYIGYLVSPPSSCRLNTRKEAGLLGAVVLTQKIIVYLSDTTLMDMLMKINQDVLLPLLDLLTSPKMGFPSGVQSRSAVCLKTISLMALIWMRIGREMVQQHMADTLCKFFQVFSLLDSLQNQIQRGPRKEVGEYAYIDVCTPGGTEMTCELGVLEELQAVFNPEMAYNACIPSHCLIGDTIIRKVVPNYELVWGLAMSYFNKSSLGSPESNLTSSQRAEVPTSSMNFSPSLSHQFGRSPFPAPSSTSTPLSGDALPESGTFGSHLVGNRIQVARDTEPSGSPSQSSFDIWGRSHVSYIPSSNLANSMFASMSVGPVSSLSSSSWVLGHTPEDSALKQELPRSSRSLQGNWLAYWQYEIGFNQQDPRFHFHQIRLQSFLGHSGTVKCLAPLAGEDYFLSGSKDKTVKLWPLYNHGDGTREVEPRLTYTDHRKSVFYVAQLEALQEVVSCDGTVHIWDQFTGKQIRALDALDGKNPITAVTTMPPPHCSVVYASADSILRFVDPRKPGLQHEFRLAYNNLSAGLIRCLAVSPGGRTVAAGFSSGFIVLLDARTGLVLRGWPAHEGDILQMKAAEGNLLISSSTDHTLTVWKDLEHKPLHLYRTPDPIHAFDLYGAEIVAGTVANKIGVYSMMDISASPASCTKLSSENFRGTLTSLAVLPTKRLLLLGSENGAIRLLA